MIDTPFEPTPAGIEQFKDRMAGYSVIFDSNEDAVRFMQTLHGDFETDRHRAGAAPRKLP